MMIDSITATAISYLSGLGISCSERGVKKNIEEWYKNKMPLLELLRKHPMWRENELAIVTTITEKRELDSSYFNYFDQLRSLCFQNSVVSHVILEKLRAHITSNYNDDVPENFFTYFSLSYNNDSGLRFVVENCFSETITDSVAEIINLIAPEFKFKGGQKSSRVLNKVFDYLGFTKHPEYNCIFAKISDCISPRDFKRTAVLSVNPMDYLTMSNGNSWSNCMCLTPSRNFDGFEYQGKHKAGCMSYLTDGVSLLFYTLDDNRFKSAELWKIPKITRQVIFYSSPHIIHERIYPKSIDYCESENNPYYVYRNCVWKIISECEEVQNRWTPYNTIIKDKPDTFMYPDWKYYTVLRYVNPNIPKQSNTISVGDKTYCIKCGEQRYRSTSDVNDIMCSSLYCENCDPTIESGDEDNSTDENDDSEDYNDDIFEILRSW